MTHFAPQPSSARPGVRVGISKWPGPIEYFPEHVDRWLDRNRRLFLLLFSVLYLLATAVIASRRPLWADEVLTAYMSRLPLHDLWPAVGSGVDLEPPLFHWITRAFTSVLGESPLVLRMPAVLGGWLISVTIFIFVARRFRTLYAAVAMLIPFVTGAANHMYEARSYVVALGFTGVALVCWQRAVERSRRKIYLTGFGCSLAAALASHYYMVLALLAIALGEAVRAFTRKRIDAPVWIVLACAMVPLALHAPLIRAAMTFTGAAWWSVASFQALLEAYAAFTVRAIFPVILVVAGMVWFRSNRFQVPSSENMAARGELPKSELSIALALTFALVGAFVLARLTNGIFSARYGICLVFGLALLPLPLMAWYDTVRPIAGVLSFLVLAAAFLGFHVLRQQERFRTPELLLRADPSLAIVVENPLEFMELIYNAPPTVASRLHYLASRADSIRYAGGDDDDRGLLLLRKYFPIAVESPDEFLKAHNRFLVWQGGREQRWLLQKLVADGAAVTLSAIRNSERLLLVKLQNP